MAEHTHEEVVAYIENLVAEAKKAQKEFYANFKDQHSVDAVVRAAGMWISVHGNDLARAAVGETGMGNMQGKIQKMELAALSQWNQSKGKPSVGVIEDRNEPGVKVLCKPMGIIGCVIPSTNPIATVIANSMMAFKCRNAVVIAGHPASAHVSNLTAKYIADAVEAVGAPRGIIQYIDAEWASIDATKTLLALCDANLATGGAGMVKSVYSAGRPAFGVGQGNCQDIVDEEYPNFNNVATNCIMNRSFDQGVPCTGDQNIIYPLEREEEMMTAMKSAGAFMLEKKQDIDAFRKLAFPEKGCPINRKIVGRSPYQIGQMLGIDIPEGTPVIAFKNQKKGDEDDLCREILCPVIRMYGYKTFEEGVQVAIANLEAEGQGHSSAIWSKNWDRIMDVADRIPVCRFHVEQPSGGSPDNGIPATLTIGCGTWGGNSISENLQW